MDDDSGILSDGDEEFVELVVLDADDGALVAALELEGESACADVV